MNEAKFQTFITKWMLYRYPIETGYDNSFYDCKVVSGLSFAPSKLKPHQRRALKNAASETGLSYKIPDVGNFQKPLDGFMGRNAHSWLVILFKKDIKEERFFCLFDIKKWNDTSVTPQDCHSCFSFYSPNEIPRKLPS